MILHGSRVASILMLWLKLFLKENAVAMAKVLSVICPKVRRKLLQLSEKLKTEKDVILSD
ncbi:hypothetical protein BEC89_21915 [Escherichia coli]|nr:hypothetical protein [Escherichia coli]